ncbi:hypothetical protein BC834DRAFT_943424, partial [Gloeopeniophorella convolvens]
MHRGPLPGAPQRPPDEPAIPTTTTTALTSPSPRMAAPPTPDWAKPFPEPRTVPPKITPDALCEIIRTQRAGTDYLVVDVRRADIEALITGALNLPAQTFYPTLPALVPLLARVRTLVFHCQTSLGRGPRCAGWFADALAARGGGDADACTVVVLEGGMRAWLARFAGDAALV